MNNQIMKKIIISALLLYTGLGNASTAYNKDTFEAAKKGGEKILLHFHAEWCPTCKKQEKALNEIESAGDLKPVQLFVVDFDKEKDLKKDLKVNAQSTFVAFLGGREVGRSSSVTDKQKIKEFIDEKLRNVSLNEQLGAMKEASGNMVPADKKEKMMAFAQSLESKHLEKKAPKVGQKLKPFSLTDSVGNVVSLKELIKTGPVMIAFYRGSWCPYCNAQLNDLRNRIDELKSKNITVVAISPDNPEITSGVAEQKKLPFVILSDKDNKYARSLGLVFSVPDDLKKIYMEFGIDLQKSQGNNSWELPLTATFLVGKDGKIIYSFVNSDYTKRADISEIIKVL
ncbi:MAG: hypothetical protein B7Y39_05545 [Bdellovibrio sp. 28-41-41]|nr:MAG: hypothetical protein B7Y39_05545 [Bdellovibrio sp. 28-41-41]